MLKQAPARASRVRREGARGRRAAEEKIDDILQLFVPFTREQKGPFSCANTRAAYRAPARPRSARASAGTPEKIDWATTG